MRPLPQATFRYDSVQKIERPRTRRRLGRGSLTVRAAKGGAGSWRTQSACARELAVGLQTSGVTSEAIAATLPTALMPSPNFYLDAWRTLAPTRVAGPSPGPASAVNPADPTAPAADPAASVASSVAP